MNTSTILGIIVGFFTISVGMVLKGANPAALINPAALVIIFVGTFAALLNAFPMKRIASIPKYFGILFRNNNLPDMADLAKQFVSMAQLVRREGILVLEKQEFSDPFIQSAVDMLVDGTEPQVLEDVLESNITAMEDRHKVGIQVFSQAGTYAPTLGVLGAVIGLVAALGNLNDIDMLGHSIAAAFIATLFGIFSGYVLWHPFANKLKQMSKDEIEVKRMVIHAILAIQAGNSPSVIQAKLIAYVPESKRDALYVAWGRK